MKKLRAHAISGVFVFLLLGIFAVLSTVMVLFGANAYKNSGTRTDEHNTERILSTYARSRLRSCDEAGSVSVESVMGVNVTYDDEGNDITQDIGEINCLTLTIYSDEEETIIDRIYVYEGSLMERMYDASEPFEPERGIRICDADNMDVSISDGLVTISLTAGDETVSVDAALRSKEAEQ